MNTIFLLIPAPSSPPTNITVLHTNSTSFTLSWLPPPPEDHNGDIIEYQVTITRLSTLVTTTLITNTTQLLVVRLVPYNGYEVTMAAFTSEGSGPHTEPLFLQTDQEGKDSHKYILLKVSLDQACKNQLRKQSLAPQPCLHNWLVHINPYMHHFYLVAPSVAPTNTTILLILPRSITISWVSPEQELLNGQLTHFLLEIFEEDTNTTSQTISISEEVTLEFLHPFYMYRVHVSAVTVLPGPFSEELLVTTLEDGNYT